MSTPACACLAVNQLQGACLGEYTACAVPCEMVARTAQARGQRQLSCWEKTHARVDQVRATHTKDKSS